MKKSQLPQKTCPVCLRPFSWRKKWQRDWPNVKYCSKRCAGNKSTQREPHE
ncbi:DUF2256 domain-containing protein [Pseudoalteromonas rubra]|uniref:DUF2256 domain-containing protein n=2 Tax=Pseudoalteromonas TaxID=53246 RepID=A0A5S3WZK3_9GAMM|nr:MULTISPECIES: DUF2256 domain-containing protein [Pseudoalteromonas]MCG7534995.1 DUF2256 domain-containing protein [Pseudoalteromonas sp. OOF1S-7]QTL34727.1 DUF2256 domain-containing protein [Pseudoalteromonas viridis]TMP28180.1 DUF2256 domain-containing protein [Pseudoalteromonas rubra]TMP34882.1 DUF2256 domain-containing protein [Pseudoalteromonas rubra]TMP35831.1 DUF2256 domain-containing protein [Pseudoalteromonas rubra]